MPLPDGTVVARLNIRRPPEGTSVDLRPTYAHLPTVQISGNPGEHRSLASAMDAMRDAVLQVLASTTDLLGLAMPDPESLEWGETHEAIAPEYGGHIALLRDEDGTLSPIPLDRGNPHDH